MCGLAFKWNNQGSLKCHYKHVHSSCLQDFIGQAAKGLDFSVLGSLTASLEGWNSILNHCTVTSWRCGVLLQWLTSSLSWLPIDCNCTFMGSVWYRCSHQPRVYHPGTRSVLGTGTICCYLLYHCSQVTLLNKYQQTLLLVLMRFLNNLLLPFWARSCSLDSVMASFDFVCALSKTKLEGWAQFGEIHNNILSNPSLRIFLHNTSVVARLL